MCPADLFCSSLLDVSKLTIAVPFAFFRCDQVSVRLPRSQLLFLS
jgi:hypothetical protein